MKFVQHKGYFNTLGCRISSYTILKVLSQKYYILLLLLFGATLSFGQTLIIGIDEHYFHVDETNLLIVSQLKDIEVYNDLTGYDEIILALPEVDLCFTAVPVELDYNESYQVKSNLKEYTLYFTELPLITIQARLPIVDAPKVHATFTYADSNQLLQSDIGVELRGGSSQSYPKKTFDLEFWEDETGTKNRDVQFGNLRKDDDWIMDALYNEPLRMRSHMATALWGSMHTPHYLSEEPNAKSGARTMYVEVFLNGMYNGLYDLSEPIDRKQLQLEAFDRQPKGELLKGILWGATTFTSLPNYNNSRRTWAGYEFKYPKQDEVTDWENIYSLTDFVINADDNEFKTSVWNRFDLPNHLDYFIFLNLLRATDNTGKNIYVAKQKENAPYFYIPWDLDGSFGTLYNGARDSIFDDILTNGFFERALELNPINYTSTLSDRWFMYRSTLLQEDSLIENFEDTYRYLLENKIYEREGLVYPNYSFERQDLEYLESWLNQRLNFLDNFFSTLVSTTKLGPKKVEISVYPNPASSELFIVSDTHFDLNTSVELINAQGVKFEEIEIAVSGNTITCNVYSLPVGNYTVLVIDKTRLLNTSSVIISK